MHWVGNWWIELTNQFTYLTVLARSQDGEFHLLNESPLTEQLSIVAFGVQHHYLKRLPYRIEVD